jgi:hypothetical protein
MRRYLVVAAAVLGPVLVGSLAGGLLAYAWVAPTDAPASARPSAAAAAGTLGDHYAALQRLADSVRVAQSAEDAAPSEVAQVTARNLAGRIRALADDYGSVSLSMTAAEYERGVSLWMRLALAQAALDMLEEDAARLGADAATGPADLRDLADQLSGVLELGRVTGRVASRAFGAPLPPPPAGAGPSATIS